MGSAFGLGVWDSLAHHNIGVYFGGESLLEPCLIYQIIELLC